MEIFSDFEATQKILVVLSLCMVIIVLKIFKGIVKAILIPLILLGLAAWYFLS